jgi:hypothetical protein
MAPRLFRTALQPVQVAAPQLQSHSQMAAVLYAAKWTMTTAACSVLWVMSWRAAEHTLQSSGKHGSG